MTTEGTLVGEDSLESKSFGFTVDTRLFRELGQYLVGRNSTALIELVKNSYDADATMLIVSGHDLQSSDSGSITLVDDGIGMTPNAFREGFLRIAARSKAVGDRRSKAYGRRLTGAKGVGRIAAHKLARELRISSIPSTSPIGIEAILDWDEVESRETLDQLDGIPVVREIPTAGCVPGTAIELVRLRERWTKHELDRFIVEVGSFQPPTALIDALPRSVMAAPLLFERPQVRSSNEEDPGFEVQLLGDFETGDTFWPRIVNLASWVLEIEATPQVVHYAVGPTVQTQKTLPTAKTRFFDHVYRSPDHLPTFQSRVIVREGRVDLPRSTVAANSGVRVYVEGFRVLPYGDVGNDWLSLNQDATGRSPRSLHRLRDAGIARDFRSAREELLFYSNFNYHGAIFLTNQTQSELKMLVNREGFIPDQSFDALTEVTRLGIDLTTRIRAHYREGIRKARRKKRSTRTTQRSQHKTDPPPSSTEQLQDLVTKASTSVAAAVTHLQDGNNSAVAEAISQAGNALEELADIKEEVVTESSMLRVLASVGLQLSAVVHEITAIAAAAGHLVESITSLAETPRLSPDVRRQCRLILSTTYDLKHTLERQAAFLTDLVAADARRRRSRQNIHAAFESAVNLVGRAARSDNITIVNTIPKELRSPPMFKAEIVSVFTNLLTNAIKAAASGGAIKVSGRVVDKKCEVLLENTGVRIDPATSERWFEPFESTTAFTRPLLGQGMGLGLPITRRMIESYRGTVEFVQASTGFSTAVVIRWPT